MKIIKIRSLKYPDPAINWDFQSENEEPKLSELLASGVCGLPERPELDEMGQPTGVILPAEYTVEIEDITAQVAQEAINAEALAYLASTDWLIIREVDAGVPCPAEIKAERAAARARVIK